MAFRTSRPAPLRVLWTTGLLVWSAGTLGCHDAHPNRSSSTAGGAPNGSLASGGGSGTSPDDGPLDFSSCVPESVAGDVGTIPEDDGVAPFSYAPLPVTPAALAVRPFSPADHPRLLLGPSDRAAVIATGRTDSLSAKAIHYWKSQDTAGLHSLVGEVLAIVNTMHADPSKLDDIKFGNRMSDAMLAYDFLTSANVFTAAQRTTLQDQAFDLAEMAAAGGTIPYTGSLATWPFPGWISVAAAFPENARAGALLQEASSQLNQYLAPESAPTPPGATPIHEDGVWFYSYHYVTGAAGKIVPAMIMLQRNGGANYLVDPRFKRAIRKAYDTRLPPNRLNANYVRLPAMGDSFNPWNDDLPSLTWVASAVRDVDPAFSAELMGVSEEFGGVHNGQTYVISDAAYAESLNRADLPTTPAPKLASGKVSSVATVFREHVGTEEESYLLLVTPAAGNFGHQHDDRGSINLFSRQVPLLLDAGTLCYGCAEQPYYRSALSHNRITFLDAEGKDLSIKNASWVGWGANPSAPAQATYQSFPEVDYAVTPVYAVDATKWVRHVLLLRGSYETYWIWDQLASSYRSVNNLHFLSQAPTTLEATSAVVHGYEGLDVDVNVLDPADAVLTRDPCDTTALPGACGIGNARAKWTPANTVAPSLEWLKVTAPAGKNQLVVMTVHQTATPAPRVERLPVEASGVSAYRVTVSGLPSRVVVVNENDTPQTITLPGTGAYRGLTAPITCEPQRTVVPGGRLSVFSQDGT